MRSYIHSDALRRFHDHIMSRPTQFDIDPAELPPTQLCNIMLIGIVAKTRRFRYRIAGAAIEDIYARRLHGRFLDSVFESNIAARKRTCFQRVIDDNAILLTTRNHGLAGTSRPMHRHERLLVPFAHDGCRITKIIGCLHICTPKHTDADNDALDVDIIHRQSIDTFSQKVDN